MPGFLREDLRLRRREGRSYEAKPKDAMRAGLTIFLKCVALAPAFLLGIPVQALLNRLGNRFARRLPVLVHRYICRILGVRVSIVGILPPPGPMLLVANHVSWLDVPVLGSLMPVAFVAKSEVAHWPFFGTLARLQHTVFVERHLRQTTGRAAATIAGRLSDGEAIVVFAEGTTGDGIRILPYRSSLIAAATNNAENSDRPVTVEPIALTYTHRNGLPITRRDLPEIAWYGDMNLVPHLTALLAGGPIDVTVCFGPTAVIASPADRKKLAHDARSFARAANRNARLAGRASRISEPDR